MVDTTHNVKVWLEKDILHIADGGLIQFEGTGTMKSPGGTDLVPNKHFIRKQVADISAEATYYMIATRAGLITSLKVIMDGAVLTADATATFSINGVAVTTGVITMPTAASAAGDILSATPTALNTVAVGDKISFVVTGGGAAGTGPRADFLVEITAQ